MGTERAGYLSAKEAADRLGISVATLYSYVSRGLLRSEPANSSDRTKRYHAEDVETLRRKQEQRKDPAGAPEAALHWGAPLIDSAITLIADGKLSYRGRDAILLAHTATVEQVTSWIWALDETALTSRATIRHFSFRPEHSELISSAMTLPPIHRFAVGLAVASASDVAASDIRPEAVMTTGASILALFTRLLAGCEPGPSIAGTLAAGWGVDTPAASDLLTAALILCADHELNASTFTTRCAASTGANPYAAVAAGLAALQGPQHGGHTARVEALMREVGSPEEARETIEARVRRADPVPGFGHRLYPDGDPRAACLLQMIEAAYPGSAAVRLNHSIVESVRETLNVQPTVDFALVALCRALGRPAGSALGLFALGRTIGWIGHAMEQYALGKMVRPRARYTGPPPQEA